MSYACREWYHDIDIDTLGETLDDVFRQRNCRLTTTATAWINTNDGSVDEYMVDDYSEIYCNEHDSNADEVDHDDIVSIIEDRSPWYTCLGHDDHDDLVFPEIEAYETHMTDAHGEDDEDEEVQAEEPLIEANRPCARPHPPLSIEQRKAIQERLRTFPDTDWKGLLVPTAFPTPRYGVMECSDTNIAIAEYQRDFPQHFWIARNDPHIFTPGGKTSHSAWA